MSNSIFNANTNEWWVNGTQRFTNIHPISSCEGRPCIVHNPDKDWVANREDWPYLLRETGLWERMSPSGIGHPDRDGLWYLENELGLTGWGVHGCDGTCA